MENRHKVTYEISPNESDFKNATRDIINRLETAVGKRYFLTIRCFIRMIF